MKNIIPENIYQEVTSYQKFYSLMYPDYVKFMSTEEQIVSVKTSSIKWNPNKTLFYYVWGWPGPDCNMYDSENYGKTWAFTTEELIEYWNRKNYNNECEECKYGPTPNPLCEACDDCLEDEEKND